MGAGEQQRRWRAYANAATACAIYLHRIVEIGALDLSRDYRDKKLEEMLKIALALPDKTDSIRVVVNWGILAQVEVGRSPHDFAGEYIIVLPGAADPGGSQLMRSHWPAIERLAHTLLIKGQVSAAEAIEIIEAANASSSG